MEEFPETFRLETFKQTILDKNKKYQEVQKKLIARERSKIVQYVTNAVEKGEKSVIITLHDDLCQDMKYKLSEELLERFPGCMWYHSIIGYADVDEFRKMNTPVPCWEYKIVFE